MIITVLNESPFQILSSSFSIGPSQTGYELQVGADSRSFTTLFSVGANTPRMVTNVANGSYYRLKNNVGEVKVNWQRVCVDEGGSGGSGGTTYTAGDYIDLTGDVISVTGITPDAYLTSADTEDFATEQYVQEALSGIDLSNYWTSAQTQSAITEVEEYVGETIANYTPTSGFSTINGSAITAGGDLVIKSDTEDIELPIAAAVNDLKANIEARLNQKYYERQEVNDLLDQKRDAAQVQNQIVDYVTPVVADIAATIEDKELATSAALNDLNTNCVKSSFIDNIWKGTQGEYDTLTNSGATADPSTFYIIVNNN